MSDSYHHVTDELSFTAIIIILKANYSILHVPLLNHNIIYIYNYYQCPYRNTYELVSDVIGTSIKCGSSTCQTDNFFLSSPVKITFEHSNELMVSSL